MKPTPEMIKAARRKIQEHLFFVGISNDIVEAALTAALAVMWRPIETAPKDGDTNILIGCFNEHWHGEQFVVFYDEHPDIPGHPWQTPDGIGYSRDAPTHWMPLADPPQETA